MATWFLLCTHHEVRTGCYSIILKYTVFKKKVNQCLRPTYNFGLFPALKLYIVALLYTKPCRFVNEKPLLYSVTLSEDIKYETTYLYLILRDVCRPVFG
jgi:hypothetical protein